MFKLILKFQDTVVEEYTFDKTPVTLGRREDNDVVIDNQAVSGHHARIEAEEPNYYVLLDLDSLNGTFLNEKKVTRERVFDGDFFIVGKHVLSFLDLRPEAERPRRDSDEPEKPPVKEAVETVLLDPKEQEALLAKEAAERAESGEPLPPKPKKIELHGAVTVISGGVPQIVELSKRLTTLGKADDADIKCSGLLVGKTAAVISKRPNGFFLSYSEGTRKPKVNGQEVSTQVQLQDGDEIAIANTHMTFSLREIILS
ncbi:MAG: FHA domain-containing protein [Desulfomonile tiedjei]|nr:FHA domain-containing protein [Desulfomonile tiedjei]